MKHDMILSEATVAQLIKGGAGNRARDITAMLSGQASIEHLRGDRYLLILRDDTGNPTEIVEAGLVTLLNEWLLRNSGYRVYKDRRKGR